MSENLTPQLEIRGIVKPKRRWPAVLAVSAVVLAGGLTTGGFAYATHYQNLALPNTVIGGTKVGGLTPQEVSKKLQDNCENLKVKFTGAATGSFSLAELGLNCDVPATTAAVMTANDNLRGLLASTLVERRVEAKFTLDESKATAAARKLSAGTPGSVSDPSLTFDGATGQFTVTAGAPGQGIDPKQVSAAAVETWKQQQDGSTKVEFTEVQPLAPAPELGQWAETANGLISPRVYLIGRGIGHVIEPTEKAQWIEITENGPTINQAQVLSWLKTFTDEFVDVKADAGERQFTKDGKLLTMTKMAWNSKLVSNNAEIAQGITESLNSGKSFRGVFTMETKEGSYNDQKLDTDLPTPPYSPKAQEVWVSVDLTNHTTTAWKGNQVIWGPVAVVHGSIPSPTYPGIFHIQSKWETNRMRGEGWDGEYDVWSPWTMYYSGSYAIHGAASRANWVQTNYGGSHGCVNMKPAEAAELYQLVEVGTTVVIHRGGKL
ncbi:MAG: L,D-transpeptidase [Mobiluncus porci]|uniref:L,D-transpeptidase n=1 Tax=Mobiluncus porci TaxID=2652278 RepID=UPI0023F46B0D|nr:L,D-transpeptidase [Mobiluncus porci]MDD7542483.1 L,D-transpeptidase [Mobiluncus porci]MDY5748780.1 L,D-transpeptidase [Mobiluncus porci]